MKKLVYLFVAMFATSMMFSCTGKTGESKAVDTDSTEVDSTLVDSVDSAAVDSVVCPD